MSLKKTLRVMIVDDMSVSRGLITQCLEALEIWNVDEDASAESALRKIAANPVHLVISDYNMPNMDGLQLLQCLRQNRLTQRTGFILVTGSPTPQIVDTGRKLGMNNMLKKPFSTAQMKHAIEAVVGRL